MLLTNPILLVTRDQVVKFPSFVAVAALLTSFLLVVTRTDAWVPTPTISTTSTSTATTYRCVYSVSPSMAATRSKPAFHIQSLLVSSSSSLSHPQNHRIISHLHQSSQNNEGSTSSDNERTYSNVFKRRNVQLALLDMSSLLLDQQQQQPDKDATDNNTDHDKEEEEEEQDEDDNDDESKRMIPIVPLPASHLPDELATLQMYGIQLKTGMQKLMMKDITTLSSFEGGSNAAAVSMGGMGMMGGGDFLGGDEGGELFPAFGYVVEKYGDDMTGAIGCAADVIFVMDEKVVGESGDDIGSENDNDNDSLIVLCKGSFRFVVKEMLQTFPYPIAIVDELLDEEPSVGEKSVVTTVVKEYNDFEDVFEEEEEDDDDDDDDEDALITVDSSELIPRTMAAMKTLVDQKLNTNRPSMTPLEEAILKESGRDPSLNVEYLEKNRAEEMAAILDIFASSLLDIAPTKMERFYVVAIMAAEFAGLDNDVRRKMLTMVDGVARLRLVLAEAEKKISLVQAKKITEEIMQKNDEGSRELKVGVPSLPPWAKSIKKGLKIEYFWNEIEGWCKGEVIENPVMVLDELIVTVRFEDGDIEKLPFRADEKARWRPGGMGR